MTSLTRLNKKIDATSASAEVRWQKLTQLFACHCRNTSAKAVFLAMAALFCVGGLSERLHNPEKKSGKIARKTADLFLSNIIFNIAALSTSSAIMLRSVVRTALLSSSSKKSSSQTNGHGK